MFFWFLVGFVFFKTFSGYFVADGSLLMIAMISPFVVVGLLAKKAEARKKERNWVNLPAKPGNV